MQAQVVFLDEPAAFLDPEKRQIAAAHIAEYSRKNLVVWTSHYPSELPPAEKLFVLRDAGGALQHSVDRVDDELCAFDTTSPLLREGLTL